MAPTERQRAQRLAAAEGYLQLDMPDHALEQLRGIAELGELQFVWHLMRGECYRAKRDWAAALTEFRACYEVQPENLSVLLGQAWCYKRVDRLSDAIAIMHEALQKHAQQPIVLYNLACYYALAGDKPHALSWLGRALRMDRSYARLIQQEADFDLLRHDPDFRRLVQLVSD